MFVVKKQDTGGLWIFSYIFFPSLHGRNRLATATMSRSQTKNPSHPLLTANR